MRTYVGIDEVGRGSLAGPVTVAAVGVPRRLRFRSCTSGKLRDSKKLTKRQREAWFAYFRTRPDVCFAVARVFPRTIDNINITKSANLAAFRAYRRLIEKRNSHIGYHRVFLDGGLYLGSELRAASLPGRHIRSSTVIRGDEKYTAIKVASIIAKVTRDRFMTRLHARFPAYGFGIHKGYGTKRHLAAIRKHGPSAIHRLTFIKKYIKI